MNKKWLQRFATFSGGNLKAAGRIQRNSLNQTRRGRLIAGVAALALILAGGGTTAMSQESERVYKVGRLGPGFVADPLNKATLQAFQDGIRDLGWVEGKNIVIENRWTGDRSESAGGLAAELVRLKVDVIVAVGSPMVQAAKQATTAIPIVMSGSGADPVAAGFVASLRRPGGNVTGLSMLSTELSGKRLELLKEMAPKLRNVAVLRNPKFPAVAIQSNETEVAAKSLSLHLRAWDVSGAPEIENAFASMSKARATGLVVFSDPVILERNRGTIINLALKHRIPTIYPWRNYVEEGGLASYSASLLDMHRRSATYVNKILKGAKAAELPVEQPTKFEFIVNLKTAKQIGLTIPPNVLVRADKVLR